MAAGMVAGAMMAGAMWAGSMLADVGLISEEDMVEWEKQTMRSERKHRTVTILDWDDTLLPSTALVDRIGERGTANRLPSEFRRQLHWVEDCALRLLSRAMMHGSVMIITAGEQGWVERSGAQYMPRVLDFLKTNSIPIVSARNRYQKYCKPIEWKMWTFHDELRNNSFPTEDGNLVVIGDGISEVLAARSLLKTHRNMAVKTIKLSELPSAKEVALQLSWLDSSLDRVYERPESFEIAIENWV